MRTPWFPLSPLAGCSSRRYDLCRDKHVSTNAYAHLMELAPRYLRQNHVRTILFKVTRYLPWPEHCSLYGNTVLISGVYCGRMSSTHAHLINGFPSHHLELCHHNFYLHSTPAVTSPPSLQHTSPSSPLPPASLLLLLLFTCTTTCITTSFFICIDKTCTSLFSSCLHFHTYYNHYNHYHHYHHCHHFRCYNLNIIKSWISTCIWYI